MEMAGGPSVSVDLRHDTRKAKSRGNKGLSRQRHRNSLGKVRRQGLRWALPLLLGVTVREPEVREEAIPECVHLLFAEREAGFG